MIPAVFSNVVIERVRDEEPQCRCREHTHDLNKVIAGKYNRENDDKTAGEVPSYEEHRLEYRAYKYDNEAIVVEIHSCDPDNFLLRREGKEIPDDVKRCHRGKRKERQPNKCEYVFDFFHCVPGV